MTHLNASFSAVKEAVNPNYRKKHIFTSSHADSVEIFVSEFSSTMEMNGSTFVMLTALKSYSNVSSHRPHIEQFSMNYWRNSPLWKLFALIRPFLCTQPASCWPDHQEKFRVTGGTGGIEPTLWLLDNLLYLLSPGLIIVRFGIVTYTKTCAHWPYLATRATAGDAAQKCWMDGFTVVCLETVHITRRYKMSVCVQWALEVLVAWFCPEVSKSKNTLNCFHPLLFFFVKLGKSPPGSSSVPNTQTWERYWSSHLTL